MLTDYFLYKKQIKCLDTLEECIGYKQYLKSNHWDIKRRGILKNNNRCANCNETLNLEIHHLNYKNLGNEKLEDLIVLCKNCHKIVHECKNSINFIEKDNKKSKNKRKEMPKLCFFL